MHIGEIALSPMGLAFLGLAGIIAGIADATTGGGGMVQIPAIFSIASGGPAGPPLALNKSTAAVGNFVSYLRFRRAAEMARVERRTAITALSTAIPGALCGVALASNLTTDALTPYVIAAMLIAVVYIALIQPRLASRMHTVPQASGSSVRLSRPRMALLASICAAIGFYDGVLGPATGSFLILILQWILVTKLTQTLATAKFIQLALNTTGALAYCAVSLPSILPFIVLASANALGGAVGSRWVTRFSERGLRMALGFSVACAIAVLLWAP